MKILGNIIWFIFGGLICGLLWAIYGIFWCCTIIGIPIGIQCFKFAALSFAPFGTEVKLSGGPLSLIANIAWILITGLEMTCLYAAMGILFCCTIVGIPFGKQFFKLAKLTLLPFGTKVR